MTSGPATYVAQLVAVGDDIAVVFPPELLAAWGVSEGDSLDLVAVPGGFQLRKLQAPEAPDSPD